MPISLEAFARAAAVCDAAILGQPLPLPPPANTSSNAVSTSSCCAACSSPLSLPQLVSVFRSRYGLYVRRTAHLHRGSEAGAALEAARARGSSILAVALAARAPPTALARLAVTQALALPAGSRVGAFLTGAGLNSLPQALACEVAEAVAADSHCSPPRDVLRAAMGAAHEALLRAALRARGVPFADEGELRGRGYAKTPDIKLDLPVGVRAPGNGACAECGSVATGVAAAAAGAPRVITWIDSKATLGDPATLRDNAEQLAGYANRFGPGLVIYWGGAVPAAARRALPPDVLVAEGLFDEWVLPGDAAVRRAAPGEWQELRRAAEAAAEAAALARHRSVSGGSGGDDDSAWRAQAAALDAAAARLASTTPLGALTPRHVARLYADAGLESAICEQQPELPPEVLAALLTETAVT